MTDITPADLARFVHPVPVGATIPAGMEFVRRYMDGGPTPALAGPIVHDFDIEAAFSPLWTAEPLAAPKPPLPTEVGAVIANVVPLFDGRDPEPSDTCPVMVLGKHGQWWFGLDANGYARSYATDQIASWTPARIVADEAVTAPSVNVGSLKMAREALCVAEHRMLKGLATPAQIGQISAMIADIDRQRPVGPDGRHGSRHTATCGCEDR